MNEREYFTILIDSLKKKLAILAKIQVLNSEQRDILLDEMSGPDELELNVNAKDELISQITDIDDGFEAVYSHVENTVKSSPERYKTEISELQSLIKEIVTLDTLVRADEQKNHDIAQKRFENIRRQIKEVKVSQKTVNKYYQNMMRVQQGMDPRFVDNKK